MKTKKNTGIYLISYYHNTSEDLRNFHNDNAYYDLKLEKHTTRLFGKKKKVKQYTKRVCFHAFSMTSYERMFDEYIKNRVDLSDKPDYSNTSNVEWSEDAIKGLIILIACIIGFPIMLYLMITNP